jgi:hypothetical protein
MAASSTEVTTPRNLIQSGFSARIVARIVIGQPMSRAAADQTHPFAVKDTWSKGEVEDALTRQPKFNGLRDRSARPHSWK